MSPARKFRDKVYNQFQAGAAQLHTVEMAISSELESTTPADKQKTTSLSGQDHTPTEEDPQVLLRFGVPRKRHVDCLLEYFAALRLLMGLYAYVGANEITVEVRTPSGAVEQRRQPWMGWKACLASHDTLMANTLQMRNWMKADKQTKHEPEHIREAKLLHWLRRRDELIRNFMTNQINKGWSGDEALKAAQDEYRWMWNMADGAQATALPALTDGALSVEEIMERALAARGSGSGGSAGGGGGGGAAPRERPQKRPRGQDGDQHAQDWPRKRTDAKGELWVTNIHHLLENGKVPCKFFNSRAGCKNNRCPDAHVCAVKTGLKSICGQRGHSSMNHWAGR